MHVQVNNIRIAYDEQGSGRPVLFVHGYPLNRRIWQPQVEGLAGEARALALDLRGHGESEIAPGPYGMDLLADDCAAFLDATGVSQPVALCGLSMGGYVAMAFSRRHAGRLAGLVLTATRAGPDTPEAKANRQKAAELAREEGPLAIAESMLPKMLSPKTYDRKPDLVEAVRKIMISTPVEAIRGDLLGMMERPDSLPGLGQLRVPTLILHGADDQIIPVSEAEAMQAAIQGAGLQVIPNAGHLLNLEQPEMFTHALRSFLQSI
jgi:pimeloyl-ACP methyl ester carboxylesterase